MDSFEWNKIAGAVLFALLLSVGVKIVSDTLFESEAPETPGYVIAVATEEGGAAAPQPLAVLLASADPKMGATSAKKCLACHTFSQGEPNKVGPNLYGVVNRPIASHEGYEYSDALKAFAQQNQTWTFEHLSTFVHDPKATVPGTKMTFAGLKDDKERANVLAYLRTLSDNPAPLPEPPAEAAGAEAGTAVASAEAPATDAGSAPAPAMPESADASGNAPAAAEQPQAPAEQGQQTAQTDAPAPAPAAAAPAGDATAGAAYAKRCTVCHSLDKGGPNKVGPHIFGVIGRPIASIPDYAYSPAMKAFSEGGAKHWDEATLDTYLADPRGIVPGTKMVFPGVKSEADRANVIAYLKTLTE
jgi:cytochrome c